VKHARENSHLSFATGPILLIRRSPSSVRGCPQESTANGSHASAEAIIAATHAELDAICSSYHILVFPKVALLDDAQSPCLMSRASSD